jgi:uncharacterized RDD family membrane protein YckC
MSANTDAATGGVTQPRALKPAEALARRSGLSGLLVRRWLGCWIDMVVVAALFFLPAMMLGPDGPFRGPAELSLAVGAACALLYFPITEGRWGRSLGKLVTGLIVVDADGERPGLGRAAVRTLARLVEVNPLLLGGIPAGLIVWATPARQRLGDLMAGTYVVPLSELRAAATKPRPAMAEIFD